jgi:elongation of very long chain fatty acids protein 7
MAETASHVTHTPQNFVEFYNELWSLRDKRVDGWLLMDSIWPTITMAVFYWYFCIVLGPYLMKNRAPMELKIPMQIYNIFVTLLSAYMFYETAMSGWFTHYSWKCQEVELESDPSSPGMRMAAATHLYFLSKFIEFLDTFFFIVRKKFRNVSKLQLIHHGVMPIFSFMLVRWLPNGHETFGGGLNCLVHVFMYSYYFLAALGPQMQPYLWWKRYLTTFQMVQFCCIFVKSSVVVLGIVDCAYPWQFSLISMGLVTGFFGLFFEFYVQEYRNKAAKKKAMEKAQ